MMLGSKDATTFRLPHRSRAAHLAAEPLFQPVKNEDLHSTKYLVDLAYRRAQAIGRVYALSIEDVLTLSHKFWELHLDKICILDGAAATLLTIQYNLVAGTLAPHVIKRPELKDIMHQILNFDVSGQFLLTESAHGLDAANIETVAILLPSGEFDLHTPNNGAAKFMPPNGPLGQMPRIGIVFAQLIVANEKRGVRPFLVPLSDGKQMCKGVTARLLPTRTGTKPIDHALTYFNHVRLPHASLLGSLRKPDDLRMSFSSSIWRVAVGTLSLSCIAVPTFATLASIVYQYSQRRVITGHDGHPLPIWSFRTQQLPVVHAVAQYWVLKAYAEEAISLFTDQSLDIHTRLGVATALKAVMIQHSQSAYLKLSDRCGAHGLFTHTQISQSQNQMRGVAIAEGDVLVLSIRLATELLLGRCDLPKPRYPDSLLSRHELGLWEGLRLVSQIGGAAVKRDHRSENYNHKVLPVLQSFVEAIGHRMAYEAALDAGVDRRLVAVYESGVIQLDSGWYAEHAGLTKWNQLEMEDMAVSTALPDMDHYLTLTETEPFITAPILSQEQWDSFVGTLELHRGEAAVDLFASIQTTSPSVAARL